MNTQAGKQEIIDVSAFKNNSRGYVREKLSLNEICCHILSSVTRYMHAKNFTSISIIT
jgi:hypothetical protein